MFSSLGPNQRRLPSGHRQGAPQPRVNNYRPKRASYSRLTATRASGISRTAPEDRAEADAPSDSDSGGNDSGGNRNGNKGTSVDEDPGNEFDYHGWNPFKRLWVSILARAAADPDFWYKIAVECGIDAVIIAAVNYAARGDSFWNELEFVFCNCLVSCSNDFVLVYLLSPSAATKAVSTNVVGRAIANLPPHIFAAGAYSHMQRFVCFCYKAVQYGIIGFTMGVVGSSAVNTMTNVRELTDDSFEPPTEAPSAILTGLGWLYFMGLNSNLRYNMVARAEQVLYSRYPGVVSKSGSIGLRLANNFLGAYQWVDIADEIGVSQPRVSLREERRKRQERERKRKWSWWRRREPPEPKKWPFRLFQGA